MDKDNSNLRTYLYDKSPELYNRLEPIKTHIKKVLNIISAVFPEYTDHGWAHALAVENLVYRIFGDRLYNVLSTYEIFVLIISCWFHDVGMTGAINEDSETIRREHPDRSAKYLNDHYSELNLERHEASVIGKICQSHGNWNLNIYSERLLVKQEKIKLRLLCAILGLCDACDVTCDRAPEIVYKIAKPGRESDIFWRTHLDIGGLDKNERNEIWLTAEYKSSKGKRLIEEIVNLIKSVLDITYPIFNKHNFELAESIEAQIISADPKITDISFKKNLKAENILEILTKSLYKNKNVFVRELIQNAIDACRLRSVLDISENYTPYIKVEIVEDDFSTNLFISDNGIGMDLYDIENQLSVPGAKLVESFDLFDISPDKQIFLERLIARFGIGILSCFLCCEKIEIDTLKESSNPLKFCIDDLNTKYGFLPSNKNEIGTNIKAVLKQGYNKTFLLEAIRYYIKECDIDIEFLCNNNRIDLENEKEKYISNKYKISIEEDKIEGILSLNFNKSNKLVLCHEGILVQENFNIILPNYAIGLEGYVNLSSGFVELTASRTEIEENENYFKFQLIIEKYFKKLINKTADQLFNTNLTNVDLDLKEKNKFINYLIDLSVSSRDYNFFLNDLIVENFAFNTLNGNISSIQEIEDEKIIYYCFDNFIHNTKRCMWLDQPIITRINMTSYLKISNIKTRNVIVFNSTTEKVDHLLRLVRSYLLRKGIDLFDVTDMSILFDLISIKVIKPKSFYEKYLSKNNIYFASFNEKSLYLDYAATIYLNINHNIIKKIHGQLHRYGKNNSKSNILFAYILMVANRFDLAHEFISKFIDPQTPPRL